MVKKFKLLLWKVGLRNNCPECNSKLVKQGFEDEAFGQNFRCVNDECKFN